MFTPYRFCTDPKTIGIRARLRRGDLERRRSTRLWNNADRLQIVGLDCCLTTICSLELFVPHRISPSSEAALVHCTRIFYFSRAFSYLQKVLAEKILANIRVPYDSCLQRTLTHAKRIKTAVTDYFYVRMISSLLKWQHARKETIYLKTYSQCAGNNWTDAVNSVTPTDCSWWAKRDVQKTI